jgi:hypothetical protein
MKRYTSTMTLQDLRTTGAVRIALAKEKLAEGDSGGTFTVDRLVGETVICLLSSVSKTL